MISFPPPLSAFIAILAPKVIVIPLVLIVFPIFPFISQKKSQILPYLVFSLWQPFIIIFYYLNIQKSSALNRFSELISPNNPQILYQSQTDKNLSLRSPLQTRLQLSGGGAIPTVV